MILKTNKLPEIKAGIVLKRYLFLSLFLCASVMLDSCKIYSFTGTTLSSDLKTITIQNFVMNTAGGPANLTLNFTEKLKEYYQRNTSLKLKPNDGDLFLEGSITGYELTPVAATASDKAALNRLTIRVEVRFVNTKNEDESFEKEFSFYQDFPQEQTLAQVEGSLVPKILDQLVLNIFNDTAAQW
ncbi:LptE family protein [Emticicia sp. BO119]|uniref:LptE family protein n=1 Tax=Emticicia sp. BO119 TaxID=2757768 RepID=UPI0015F0F02E|nr:LptE family protein [Emticicia sp. BO119]MBA4853265.1 LptE family protein [Emticicia sp. BO119]